MSFDDSCVYLSGDDKAAIHKALTLALSYAKRPKPPWSNARRIQVGRLVCLCKKMEAMPGSPDYPKDDDDVRLEKE